MSVFIALLRLIEAVSYYSCFCLNELFFSITGNVCLKDLDEQYTPDIVFLFCTALLFILMSLLQMHYIFLPLCGV